MILRGGVDGEELSRQIKAQRPSTRVLLMSGYSESLVVESSESASAPELLEKPFSSEKLHHKVRAVLSKPS
jgi:DNA-binding NtrC family response regulator